MTFSTRDKIIDNVSRGFGVDAYHYENREGKGLTISIGSGLLMATMDEIKSISIAVEYGKKERENIYFEDWLALCSNWSDYVFVHAWFSISKPEPLIKALNVVNESKLFWKSNVDLRKGTRFITFRDASDFLGQYRKNNP